MKTVVGVFNDVGEARRTIDELAALGFESRAISVVAGSGTEGALKIAMAPVDITDAGRVVACGPLAEVIRGMGKGALTGSLRQFGLPAELAAHYTEAVRQGETLESLVVNDSDADRVVEVMSRHAARAEGAAPAAQAAMTAPAPVPRGHFNGGAVEQTEAIPILREELHVGKREVLRGHIHVSVHAIARPVSERVNLREEEVDVERRVVSRLARPEEMTIESREMDITEYAEEPVVAKESRIVEEVVVRKRTTSHDEVVSDKLRSTDVEVTGEFADIAGFRKYLASRGIRERLEDHIEAYKLGRKLRASGASWREVEAAARARWEANRSGTWEVFKESIQYGAMPDEKP